MNALLDQPDLPTPAIKKNISTNTICIHKDISEADHVLMISKYMVYQFKGSLKKLIGMPSLAHVGPDHVQAPLGSQPSPATGNPIIEGHGQYSIGGMSSKHTTLMYYTYI